MTTISKGASTVIATMVIGWNTSRPSRTIEHAVIGKSTPDFTLRPSGTRGGTLTYYFPALADALACETLHGDAPAPATVTDAAIPGGAMTYVVTGDVTLSASNDAGSAWQVTVGFKATT